MYDTAASFIQHVVLPVMNIVQTVSLLALMPNPELIFDYRICWE